VRNVAIHRDTGTNRSAEQTFDASFATLIPQNSGLALSSAPLVLQPDYYSSAYDRRMQAALR